MLDFRRITLFCLEQRLSKHIMTIFSKNFGGIAPLAPSWLRLWITAQNARAVSVVLWCSSYHTFECERLGEEVNILECRGATSTSISGGQFS